MQQRIYHGGTATPHGLANYLVEQFAQTRRLRAQILGEGGSLVVQIGREERAPAVTLGITQPPEDDGDLVVTMGEQQWFAPGSAAYSVAGSLAGALFTPWALFGLIWPLKHTLDAHNLPQEVWNIVDIYLIGQGATLAQDQRLSHPHLTDASA